MTKKPGMTPLNYGPGGGPPLGDKPCRYPSDTGKVTADELRAVLEQLPGEASGPLDCGPDGEEPYSLGMPNIAITGPLSPDEVKHMLHQILALWVNQPPHIKIFAFYEAPAELRALSTNGGDEDWLAIVPAEMAVPFWLDEGSGFGCCTVEHHSRPDGSTVLIGAHA